MSTPEAKRVPHLWPRPTGQTEDHYAWLADRDDPDTVAYLGAENTYAAQWFAPHGETIDQIYEEIRSRVQETDSSPPVPNDDWYYVRRTEEGMDYVILCRGRTAETAEDQLVLDVNVEAEGQEFFALGMLNVSPDHRLAALSSDTTGAEHYTVRFRDIDSGEDLTDRLTDTSASGSAWSADGTHLFYVLPDEQERPFRVMRHQLGTDQDDDVEVYRDDDERFYVGIGGTRSGEWIVIESGSKQSSEAWVVPADDPLVAPKLVAERREDVEYSVAHWGDVFVIVTNDRAEDFRIMTAPVTDPGEWTEFLPHEQGRRLVGAQAFAGHLAVLSWRDMQREIEVIFADGRRHRISALDVPHDTSFGANRNYDTDVLRINAESMSVPRTTIDVDLRTGEQTTIKQVPTPNVELADYTAERLWATAEDGVRIPVDVVRHVDTPVDGTAPCLLYGYGSYEISIPTAFSTSRLSLLDRGVTFALAHPRGGGEGGRRWYTAGKLLSKRNTFTDTLAVADHLVAAGWSAPDRLGIRGGSAGGLLVGACITMRPDRFAAAVAEVPFVDIVTTMSDPTLPLTVTEWEEWGDPRSEPWASYMLSYSPYDQTVGADYPAIYITAGLNDPRVQYHEPAKWIARLREVGTGDRPLVMKTEMGAGHQGPSGRYHAWKDEARTLTFVHVALGALD